MIKHYLIVSLLFFACTLSANAQGWQDHEETYQDANAYFYFEDYEEALALYLRIYNDFPDNANLDYRIGICYLNVAGSKERAIEYLKRASQNITNRYNENSIREKQAPLEALFYLGNAYFVSNQLDKANEAYEEFRSNIKNKRQYDMDYLNHQVAAIQKSRVIQRYPVNFLRSNLGSNINNRFSNYNAVVSADGQTLAYTSNERFYQAIMIAKREGDKWGRPRNITLDLVVNGNCSTLSISHDGTELYLFKDDNHDGNIYVSNFVDGAWTPMRKLNENINTEFYETYACISPDGKRLYFSSNRQGGYGEQDLYVSERTSGDNWGPAKNLGPDVNTSFNDNSPFVTPDEKILFFSSDGHHGVGGYDIFFSTQTSDGKWSQPINLGFPINTADDEQFYFPLNEGATGLMAVFDPNGYGEKDITQVEIFLPKYQRSIVSLDDFYARRSELPSHTLVVDTAKVSGVALLDPKRPEHRGYIESESDYTLFFEGKPYNLRDQSEELYAAVLKKFNGKNEFNTDTTTEVDVDTTDFSGISASDSSSLVAFSIEEPSSIDTVFAAETNVPQLFEDDSSLSELQSNVTDSVKTDSVKTLPSRSFQNDKEKDSPQNMRFRDLLASMGLSSDDPDIAKLLEGNWNLPPEMLFARINRLVIDADSLGKTEDMISAFAKFLDVVSVNAVEAKHINSRKISQTSYDEDFFYRLQRLKRNASPKLAAIIDEALLTQPQIASFEALWSYLINNNYLEIKPYVKEFFTLLAQSAVNGYFNLSDDEQQMLVLAAQRESMSARNIFAIIALFLAVGVAILLFLRRRKRR